MKKNIFLVALAAMSFVSCSNDEVLEVKREAISFEVASDNSSRATQRYSSTNKPESFTVYAVHTDESGNKKMYIPGTKIIKDENGSYVFEDRVTRYWPETGDLTFYAVVHPKDSEEDLSIDNVDGSVVNTLGYRWSGFPTDLSAPSALLMQCSTTQLKSENMVDYIYAVKANQKKPAATATNKKVVLNFRHALSKIAFKAQNLSPEAIYVEISEVGIYDLPAFCKFTFPSNSTDNNVTTSNGESLANQGTWIKRLYSYPIYVTDLDVKLSDNTVKELSKEATYEDDGTTVKTVETHPMSFPVKYDEYTGESGAVLYVACKIYNVSDPTKGYQEGVDALIKEGVVTYETDNNIPTINNSIYVKLDDINWEQGKKYIYTLKFGGDDTLEPISFDLTVDDYISGGDKPVVVY